jgi:hypothetical protein
VASPQVSTQFKARVLYNLKHHGDVEDVGGGCMRLLAERMGVSSSATSTAVRVLEEERLVEIERAAPGAKAGTMLIRLVNVGEYEDPFGDATEGDVSPAQTALVRPPTRKSTKSLDRIISEIEKLPLPEKLMLAGMIVDGCAGEVDETYTRLRSILGNI